MKLADPTARTECLVHGVIMLDKTSNNVEFHCAGYWAHTENNDKPKESLYLIHQCGKYLPAIVCLEASQVMDCLYMFADKLLAEN